MAGPRPATLPPLPSRADGHFHHGVGGVTPGLRTNGTTLETKDSVLSAPGNFAARKGFKVESQTKIQEWSANRVKEKEIGLFLDGDRDFIAAEGIFERLNRATEPEARQVEDILAKSLDLQTL